MRSSCGNITLNGGRGVFLMWKKSHRLSKCELLPSRTETAVKSIESNVGDSKQSVIEMNDSEQLKD